MNHSSPSLSPRASFGAAELKALARALAAYAGVLAVCAGVAMWFGKNPLVTPAWIGATGAASATLSLGLGAMLAVLTLASTRVMMRRAAWARALHADLRPVVRNADDATLVALAVASGVGEEILFRGLLVPAVGVIVSSLLFGLVHQVRGRGRWGWMAWAAAMGLLFGVVFELTGSLLGPIVAHVAINAVNLRALRGVEPFPSRERGRGTVRTGTGPASPMRPRRRLGGLLGP